MNLDIVFARLALSNPKTRAAFYIDIAAGLDDGIDVVSLLRKRLARAKQMRDPLGPVYRVWLSRMDRVSFSLAVRGFVPSSDAMIMSAAEMGGALPENMRFLAKVVVAVAAMKKAVAAAFAVPSIVFAVVLAMVYAFSKYFVPVLMSMIPPERWPASGKLLKLVADIALGYGPYFAVIAAALVGLFVWSINGFVGSTRRNLDNYPPYSIFRAYFGAITLVSLASMMGAGVSLDESLTRVARNSAKWVRWHASCISQRLFQFSGNPGKAFDTGLLPLRVLNRVIDRAERSNFASALQSIGLTVLEDVRQDVEASAKLLNMGLLLMAAGVLAMLMVGFFETTYSIQDSLKKF